ncbi:hypothetical protein [Staphylococcus arlettae]|uniref:hypothetical protein n=1 Tax=Staphylococcus arlettae TaxID=29378 RepID=UPI003BA333C9
MVLTILIGAMAAVFIALGLVDKQEKYGFISAKHILLSITYVVIAVVVGSVIDNIDVFFEGFHNSITAVKKY